MPWWFLFALGSALFAALTSILAKIGLEGIGSNVATAVRTVVIILFAWGIVMVTGEVRQLSQISTKGWIFLILSGLATGLSWLLYFRALQLGDAAKVSPVDKLSLVLTIILAVVFLKEKLTLLGWLGAGLVAVGVVILGVAH